MIGAFKKRLWKKFAKCDLDDVTRDPEDCITQLELLRGDLQRMEVNIDDVEMMT